MLTKIIFPVRHLKLGDASSVLKTELAALGRMSEGEKVVAGVFLCAALDWILRKQLVTLTGLPINDTSVALLAALVLFAWPISRQKGHFAVDWDAARHVPWGGVNSIWWRVSAGNGF